MAQTEPRSIPGFDYVGTVETDDLCNYLFSSESELNEKTNDLTGFNATTLGCFGFSAVGLAASFVYSPAGLIPLTICGGSTFACATKNIIENVTSCNDLLIDVYLASDLGDDFIPHSGVPGVIALRCQSDELQASITDIANEAENYAGSGIKLADDIVDEAYEDSKYVRNAGSDLISGLV